LLTISGTDEFWVRCIQSNFVILMPEKLVVSLDILKYKFVLFIVIKTKISNLVCTARYPGIPVIRHAHPEIPVIRHAHPGIPIIRHAHSGIPVIRHAHV
jgi:hypothetical protein